MQLGDEIVALGSAQDGGIAALVLSVDGIFKTGTPELDRSVLQAHLPAMQSAFALGDAVHRVAIETADVGRVAEVAPGIAALLPAGVRLVDWNTLLPELQQAIELDRIVGSMMYWLLMILVTLSVVNAFIMTAFERTREFGMLPRHRHEAERHRRRVHYRGRLRVDRWRGHRHRAVHGRGRAAQPHRHRRGEFR